MATSFTTTNPINTDGASAVPGASNRALGLKLFSNEVIEAFMKKNIFLNLVTTRTISGGVSSQFIVTGKVADTDVASHTPGADVAATVFKSNERVISITDRYYYSSFLDKLDEKLAQYEIRGPLAKQHAEALSTKIDKAVALEVADAAVNGTGVADQDTGTTITLTGYAAAATVEAKGDLIVEGLFSANSAFNAIDVPMEGRVFVTTPAAYAQVVQSQKAVNRDFTNGNGGIDSGNVLNIAGTPILWSNHLPIGATGIDDTSKLLGLFFTPGCVGVVKAMDITSESNYLPEKLGDLLTSYYALGMGLLNPACACAVFSD